MQHNLYTTMSDIVSAIGNKQAFKLLEAMRVQCNDEIDNDDTPDQRVYNRLAEQVEALREALIAAL